MNKEITIKRVYAPDGAFSHLELHQGDQAIKLSVASTQLDNRPNSYKWDNLRNAIDTHVAAVRKELVAQ